MGTLTRLGLGAVLASAVAVTGCSDNGTASTADMAMTTTVDLSSGGGSSELGFQLPDIGPLADLAGSSVVRVTGGFAQPFSAFFDATTNAWYVSNVSGDFANIQNLKDGRGWITKISADYKTVDHGFFTTGLNAPSGIRIAAGKLYVPDVDQLVTIDLAARTAVRSATVAPLSPFLPYVLLTDVVVDSAGVAYATETVGSRIVKFATPTVDKASSSAYATSGATFSFPTTLFIDGTKLVLGTTGNPMDASATGSLFTMTLATGAGVAKLGTFAANFQGIERDGSDYMVGIQRGRVVHRIAQANGAQSVLQDCATEGVVSMVDIGWDATNRVLAVPDASTNSIYFYKK